MKETREGERAAIGMQREREREREMRWDRRGIMSPSHATGI